MKARLPGYAAAAFVVALLASNNSALAHRSDGGAHHSDLKNLVEESNLILAGKVEKVKYVNVNSAEEGNIPHTIVTYRLSDSLRGRRPTEETFSLRFIGGADGQGGFMTVSGVPEFQEGDQDILFVKGNGEDDTCPLVNCEYGRFRVHQNQVFNTHGQPVRGLRGNHAVARGQRGKPFETFSYPTPNFDDLMKNPQARSQLESLGKSMAEARKEYARLAPKKLVVKRTPIREQGPSSDDGGTDPEARGRKGGGKPDNPIGEAPIAANEFLAKVKELHGKSERRPVEVRSADPEARIVLKAVARATPGQPEDKPEPAQQSDADRDEVRLLKAQGHNPVLPKR